MLVGYGPEGAVPKENCASSVYKEQLTGLYHPFGKTGQGVYLSSEVNGYKPGSHSESDKLVVLNVEHSVKALGITRIRPEAGRSNPG